MEGSITVILWVVWIYFILPVFTVMLWFFGVKLFYQKLIVEGGLEQLGSILLNGGIAVLMIFLLQTAWISYNYYFIYRRYGERRKSRESYDAGVYAEHFNVTRKTVENAREQSRIIALLHDDTIEIVMPETTNTDVD